MLAEIDEELPPIVVHRSTMRVVDGTHRLSAARLRGQHMIEVRYFDGSEHEAFLLAVQANITHGLPLPLEDRMAAAARIIESHPDWSDRAIAAAAGLGAQTVSGIRAERGPGATASTRMGRDGRVRPVNGAHGRLRASEIISSSPGLSLREVAKLAGISPATVRDVRERIRRGDDPVPPLQRPPRRRPPLTGADEAPPDASAAPDVDSILQGLRKDPAVRFTESGRTLLRWIFSRAIRPDERRTIAVKVPPHCTYIVAGLARRCAGEWLQFADELEERARRMA
jgi:ParB-like chromosome segregation protein Spo0J